MSVDQDPFAPVDDPQEDKKPVRRRLKTVENTEAPQTTPPDGHPNEVGISLKFGVGYGDPMFHLKASSIYTLASLVGYEGDVNVSTAKYTQGFLSWWSGIARDIQGTHKPKTEEAPKAYSNTRSGSTGTTSRRTSGGTRKQVDDDDTDWMYDRFTPPECDHGEWRPVTKVSAKGRWYAWGCPGTKEDSCSNGLEFVKK